MLASSYKEREKIGESERERKERRERERERREREREKSNAIVPKTAFSAGRKRTIRGKTEI